MSVNIEGNVSQVSAGNNWFQNVKAGGQQEKAAPQPKADDAVKVSISQEGIENYRKQLRESGMGGANGKVVVKAEKDSIIRQAKQATNALLANNYGNELTKETEKLKGQRDSGAAYSLSDRAADYVKAYGNLYDEIVQGYKDGTIERYVEDAASETGFRRMTMEEELADLDKAFQSMADKAEVDAKASKILDGYKEKLSKLKSGQKLSADADKTKTMQENVSQKLVTLAQAWKDAYKVSGSKEGGMEKVLSMLNGMFGINKEA